MKTIITLLLMILLMPLVNAQAGPVSNAFTYQGRLEEDGLPITGQVDLQVYLYDAEVGGSMIAGGYQFNAVDVDQGAFTVLLDWAPPNWDGNERWLEFHVRNPHDSGNSLAFLPLDPRQRITVVPYAIHALNAGGGGGSGYWSETGSAISNTNAGFVGVGRSTPYNAYEMFGIEGAANNWGGMYIQSLGGTASKPFYGYKTDSHLAYSYLEESTGSWILYNGYGSLYLSDIGYLGVGVENPENKITANGVIESTSGGFKFPDGSLQTTASTGGGGSGPFEQVDLENVLGTVTVEMMGSSGGSPLNPQGPLINMYTPAGDRTFHLSGGTTSGSALNMRNTANFKTVEMTSENSPGDGSKFRLFQGDGGISITMEAHGNDGDGATGPEIRLYDVDASPNELLATPTMVLHGDYNGSGESRVVANVVEITGGSDLSEHFDVASGARAVDPGSVVCIDPASPGDLRLSSTAYDRKVAGIISGADGVKPGLLMGQKGTEADGEYPVALTGRVYCKVDAQFGAIQPGDLLTTSPTPGHAMKVTDHGEAQGAILGKAMTALEAGQGMVLVLVSLQ